MMRFGLFIIGDEILSGKREDKHLAKVIGILAQRGLALSWATYLGDDRESIMHALKRTLQSGDTVFSTGGIGATPDDHTRQAAAAALGADLALHPEAERLIKERIAEMNQGSLSADENRQRLRMGEFPIGATIIPNPYNKIPGFSIGRHYFVPGFPVMAWPMLEWVLDTYFSDQFHQAVIREQSMIVYETPESALSPLMERIEQDFPGIRVFSLPSVGDPLARDKRAQRHIELGVKGSQEDVDRAYPALKAGVQDMNAPFEEYPRLS